MVVTCLSVFLEYGPQQCQASDSRIYCGRSRWVWQRVDCLSSLTTCY